MPCTKYVVAHSCAYCNRRPISCHHIVLLQLASQGVFEFGVKLLSSHPRHLQLTAFANFRNSGFQATFSTSVFLNSFVFLPGESRAHTKPSTLATSSSGTCQSQQCEPICWLNSPPWLFLPYGGGQLLLPGTATSSTSSNMPS